MKFRLINTDIFPMPGDPRFIHLASIGYGMREFICFMGGPFSQVYIEEAVLAADTKTEDVTAHLKFIEEDNLFEDIKAFLDSKKLLDVKERMGELIDKGGSHWMKDWGKGK